MARLKRRALFALPVALPVAAVTARAAPKPFATGGVVDPAKFARIIGERGPEAIMPLRRGRDGKLGILGIDAGGLDGRFVLWVHTESCGGVESRHAAPVGSRKASDRKAWSGEPGGPSGTLNQITEPEVAPGPHDTDAQSVVA